MLIGLIGLVGVVGATSIQAQAKASSTANKTRQPSAARPGPAIYFRAPSNGSHVPQSFDVVFGLKNYGVAPAGTKIASTGHFHLLVDVDAPAPGSIVPADAKHIHFGAGQIETRITLTPGRHKLILLLADGEHRVISQDLITPAIEVTVNRR